MAGDAPRSVRRKRIEPIKERFAAIEGQVAAFSLAEGLTGHNNSTQYTAWVTYVSAVEVGAEPARIKVEIGLREELLRGAVCLPARTLLENPFSRRPAVPELLLTTLDLKEAYAEKLRAALTRREPAIRDFYDIDHAVTRLNLDMKDGHFIELVLKKLNVPGNDPIDMSPGRRAALQRQLEGELRPVLRPEDLRRFHLDEVFERVAEMGVNIQRKMEARK
jgi:hypothetical protein